MKAILLIDHGSTRDESNRMLECMANLVRHMVGDGVIVEHAHMELAEPSIAAGLAACVRAGATEVIAFPYMLSPGKHSTRDIPRLVADAARAHPGVTCTVTPAFGVHEKLAEVILLRAGERVHQPAGTRCWDPAESGTACGDACRLRTGAELEGPASSVAGAHRSTTMPPAGGVGGTEAPSYTETAHPQHSGTNLAQSRHRPKA